MENYESKLAGILGTVMIHLIAAVIFMSFKLQSVKKEISENIIVEFAGEEAKEPLTDENTINLPSASVEKIFQNDPEILNIARNLANRSDIKINPKDYIDQVKEELIKNGKLGSDNFIDEQKLRDEQEENRLSFSDDKLKEQNNELPENSEKMAANYKGPTRIYYDLPGRNHTYLPLPIYKCEGSGKVVLEIEVDQRGRITSAKIIASVSTTTDPCLTETAVKTAYISRFNSDPDAPKSQTGTLTYHFVAQ
jgi:TonB family protein